MSKNREFQKMIANMDTEDSTELASVLISTLMQRAESKVARALELKVYAQEKFSQRKSAIDSSRRVWDENADVMFDLADLVLDKFKSGNSVEVERITIRRSDVEEFLKRMGK
jgi:hypothetical protein